MRFVRAIALSALAIGATGPAATALPRGVDVDAGALKPTLVGSRCEAAWNAAGRMRHTTTYSHAPNYSRRPTRTGGPAGRV